MITNIDPKSNIQTQINAAKAGDILRFPKNAVIPVSRLMLKSGIKYIGQGATLQGNAKSGGSQGSGTSDGWLFLQGLKDIDVSGFLFKSDAKLTDGGKGNARNNIYLKNCSNIKIHDCKGLKFQYSDFVRCMKSKNIEVYNNIIQAGHDGIIFYGSDHCKAYNNDFQVRINTGIRVDGSSYIDISNNNFTGQKGSGWNLIQIQNSVKYCNIFKNIFHDYMGSSGRNAAVQPYEASTINLKVFDNVLWNVGGIKIGESKNNIVQPAQKKVEYWNGKGYGAKIN